MDNTLKPIENFVKKGLSQRFQQVFGLPLAYANSPDKKAVATKLMQRGLKYPFAFASLSGESVAEGTYKPHSLWRRGLVTGASDDNAIAYRLNLIPVTTEYELTFLCQSFAEVLRFKKLWLLGSIQNALKFSFIYGTTNIDVHVNQEKRVNIPQAADGGLTDERKYELVVNLTINSYLSSDELARAQVVNEIEIETTVDSDVLLGERLTKEEPFAYGMCNPSYVVQEVGDPVDGGNMIDISTVANTYNLILFEDRFIGFTGFKASLDGKRFVLRVTQGNPGGFDITWDSNTVRLGDDIPFLEITQLVGRFDYIGFIYRHNAARCDLIAYSRGYE